MRCDESKPETEEIVAESVDRPLALSPKGLLAGNQANALKLFEVVRGFRCGGANCGCYLPALGSSICDGVDDRVVSRCLRHLLHEQDARFLVED